MERERYRYRRRGSVAHGLRWRACPGVGGVAVWWLEAFVLAGNKEGRPLHRWSPRSSRGRHAVLAACMLNLGLILGFHFVF
jgi:hypothetical protein